jgi:hypothetical protein
MKRGSPGGVKFTDSIAAFAGYGASFLARLRREYRVVDCLTTAQLLVSEIEHSQIPDSPFMPIIFHHFSVSGSLNRTPVRRELWELSMYATKIPFAWVRLQRATGGYPRELPETRAFLLSLLESDLADFVRIDDQKYFVGKRWALYLMFKIDFAKGLKARMMDKREAESRSRSVCADLIATLKDRFLDADMDKVEAVRSTRRSVKAFLRDCDAKVASECGLLQSCVRRLGLSPEEWLAIGT